MNNTPAPLEHFYVGIFAVKAQGTHVVEVPSTQDPAADLKAAWAAIRKKFPQHRPDEIRRTGNALKSRPVGGEPVIELHEGSTIRQLFDDKEFEAARRVGTVLFDGAPNEVILRHLRAKSAFAVTLKGIGDGVVAHLGKQVSVMRPVSELENILTDIFGGAGRELKLNIRIL